MKTLIVYGSKHGSTEKSTQALASKIRGDVEVIQLPGKIEPSDYDNVIIGSSIYMGSIRKEVKQFVLKYRAQLLTKKLALFLCSAFNKEDEFIANYDAEILNHSILNTNLGYEFDTKRFNFFEKMIAKAVSEEDMQPMGIDSEKIEKLADVMNQVMVNG